MYRQCGFVERCGLSAAVEQTADGVVITDSRGKIQYVNRAFTAMTGYTSDEAVGQYPRILKSGCQSAAFYEELWKAIRSGRTWDGEVINRRKDGTLYHEEMRIAPVKDSNGEIAGYIAIKRDATERRAAEEAHRFLAAIVENSEDAIIGYSPDGRILTWNRGAEAIFGYAAAEAVGKPMAMLMPSDVPSLWPSFTELVLQGQVFSQQEGVGLRKDGKRIYVSVASAPIRDCAGAVSAISVVIRDISERREAEEARAFLASIVESSDEAIHGVTLDGTVVSWNRAAERLFGYSSQEILGKSIARLAPPGRGEEGLQFLEIIRNGNTISLFETVLQAKDGRMVEISLSISPIRNAAGVVLGAAGIARDIGQRLRAERRLRESEERFRTMADGCPTMMWVTDAEGGDRFINRAYREFFGTAYEQVEGPKWQLLVHPDDGPGYIDAFQRAVRGRTAFEADARVRRADGEWRWVASYAEPRFSPDGEFLGHVGLSPDITERKQAERALQDSEEKFRQLAENIHEVFWILTPPAGQVVYISPAYEQIWGRSCDSLYRNPASWMEAIHPDDVEQARRMFAKKLKGEAVESEYRIRTPGGKEKWIRARSFPIRDQAGQVIRIAGIAEEITRQKQYEAELIRAREAADAGNRAKSRFLANMSHEIRTPMNGVVGMLQLLMGTDLTGEQQQYAHMAQTSGMALLALIGDILDLAKIEARKVVLESLTLDLRHTVEEVVQLLRMQAGAKGLSLRWRVSPETPRLFGGDPHRLRQVLTNLVANAIKFTERGEINLAAALEKQGEGRATVRFTVTDTGIGIRPEQAAALFSRFVQADDSTTRKYGGTGLGLAISKQLVELMGGTIGVESREGHGSTFWFTVVLELVTQPGPGRRRSASEGETGRMGRKGRILAVEDNFTNREVMVAQLRKLGHEVRAAADGAEAVEAVRHGQYDLVLMDCHMPVMDGFEATRRIRSSHPGLPVIAVTADAMPVDRECCLSAGMNDYLAKPVDLERLSEVLDRWLAGMGAEGKAKPSSTGRLCWGG